MASAQIRVDDDGLSLPARIDASYDVFFDGQHVWSFSAGERPVRDGERRIPWPLPMRGWLNGTTLVSLRTAAGTDFEEELQFGSGTDRIRFVDKHGIPVMIDKWGLIQRPFAGRDGRVVEEMLEITEEVIRVLRDQLGIQCWIAFGSLLGAAREGKVIAHDSDVDLAYLSTKRTPEEMNRELYEIGRVLRRCGWKVLNRSGAFVTLVFTSADGGTGNIDVYACFYLDGLLYETATVRTPMPRSAIEPLGTIEFEGRRLPAPADVDALLTASYGPSWRTPDPSFRHQPGPAVVKRFDGWFGNLMHNRRNWETFHRNRPDDALHRPGDFAHWAADRIPEGAHVVDVGAGIGNDALWFARQGRQVSALDYARGAFGRLRRVIKEEPATLTAQQCNLYDQRDVLSVGALIAHRAARPRAVYAAGLLETLEPDGRDNFFQMLRMLVRGGGTAFLEYAELPHSHFDPSLGGRRFRVSGARVDAELAAAPGAVVEHEVAPSDLLPGARRHRLAISFGATSALKEQS